MTTTDCKSQPQNVPIVKRESIENDCIFNAYKDKAKAWLSKPSNTNMDSVNFTDERFELLLDARGFPPESMKCTVSPNTVEVQATKTEDVPNQGKRNIQMARNYMLPQNVTPAKAVCCLSCEGILLITVPWQK